MNAKEKMVTVTRAVKAANSALKREMGAITLSDRMEMLGDAQTKFDLTTAIKELEATIRDLKKY